MTCEIAIMNRGAVTLAADSATTVRRWANGALETRFFKGANKIFQLSNYHPVGVMIFDTITLHEVPWELLIKEFGQALGSKCFSDLSGYTNELVSFIEQHPLFPRDFQFKVLTDEIANIAESYTYSMSWHESVKAAITDSERQIAYDRLIDSELTRLKALKLKGRLTEDDIASLAPNYKTEATKAIAERLQIMNLGADLEAQRLAELATEILFKEYDRYLNKTGFVIVGYGDSDYFPGYEEYTCHGLLAGKLLFDKTNEEKIDINTSSVIRPFAMTAMVETFVTGVSRDIADEVGRQLGSGLKSLAEEIQSDFQGASIPRLDEHILAIQTKQLGNLMHFTLEAHTRPLQRVIGSLSVGEMAELAETLIMLESLKEKVTQPTESVGGPIDVAVITKSDGFIWIKRKHYCDPEMNPRFFARQARNL